MSDSIDTTNKMEKFKVRVLYITLGWCGIEIAVNGKLIKCDAGYLGPNPLASLIDVCLNFSVARDSGEHEGDCIEEATVTWQEEPDTLCLKLKMLKSDIVTIDIHEQDDMGNVLGEWHETVPYEDFKDAIVSEGFRVLNALGLYGYYAAWSDNKEFPLSQLLRLTGRLKLKWNEDYCHTELSKEIECLSSIIDNLEIKEETHYDECKIYYEAWQLQCCGDPFAVGDKVDWTCVMPTEYRNAHGIILDFEEEHHGFATHSICGTVAKIIAERSEFPRGKRITYYPQAETIQEEILKANGHEKDFHDDEETERTLWGYIVTIKDAVVKPLPEKVSNQ